MSWYEHLRSKFERSYGLPKDGEALLGWRLRCYVVLPDGREVPWAERHSGD